MWPWDNPKHSGLTRGTTQYMAIFFRILHETDEIFNLIKMHIIMIITIILIIGDDPKIESILINQKINPSLNNNIQNTNQMSPTLMQNEVLNAKINILKLWNIVPFFIKLLSLSTITLYTLLYHITLSILENCIVILYND